MRLAPLLILLLPLASLAQVTPATGDSRTVVEPTALLYSATICAKVPATKWLMPTTTVSINPGDPYGTCTGGAGMRKLGCTGATSLEPSSSSGSYVAAETLDNPALTAAMNSCPAGQAVELVQGASGQNSLVFGKISNIANSSGAGIGVITDTGVYPRGSRSPADFGGSTCGTISSSGSTSCDPFINVSSSGAYLVGLGSWDARCWDKFTTGATTQSFCYQRLLTYCVVRGGTKDGSWTCPASLPSCSASGNHCEAYGPNFLQTNGAVGFTLYKTTFRESAQFQFNEENSSNVTVWDWKSFAPGNMPNTDWFDPLNSTNSTLTKSYGAGGDNCTALKATSGPTSNITVSNTQFGPCIGVAIGTDTTKGITNFLAIGITKNGGTINPAQQIGAEITCGSHTGTVQQITFENFYTQNTGTILNLIANNSACKYSNILARHFGDLSGGAYKIQGLSGASIGAQLDDVQTSGTPSGSSQYANLYLGAGHVTNAIQTALGCGSNNVVCTGTPASSTTPYVSTWQPLVGELNILNPAGRNNNLSVASAGPITLQAVIQPTTDINIAESPLLSAGVQFYDNGTPLGSPVALSGDNTYASYVVSSVPGGTHNYTAAYNPTGSDTNYPTGFAFGAVTAINGSPTSPLTIIYGGRVIFSGDVINQ